MSTPDSLHSSRLRIKIRKDGWTGEHQLCILDALATTRIVSQAAATVGMSRTSAYSLRDRRKGALLGALWERVFAFQPHPTEVHIDALSNGQLRRLLGNHFRRERGDFRALGRQQRQNKGACRTWPL